MKLDLFLSNSLVNSVKIDFEYIKNNLNETHYIIVPDRFSVTVEKQILKSIQKKCCFNVTVIPLSRFCNKFTSQTNKKLLTKMQSIMLIKKCINENKDKLVCFNKSYNTQNFSETIFDTIMQLKSCLVSPADLTEEVLSVSLKNKLEDIKLIYSAYEDYLKTNYIDSFNRLNLFCEQLFLQDELKSANIHFVYYEAFTPLILKVINALLRHTKSVNIALCCANKNQNNSYIYSLDMLSNIQLEANSLDITPTYHFYEEENNLQSFLRENLYSFNNIKPFVSNNFAPTLCCFSTVQNEVEFIASSITKQIQMDNKRYKDINIACSNIEDYSLLFENTFKKFNIPYYIDKSKSLMQTSLFLTIKNIILFKLFETRENLFNLLDNPFFNFDFNIVNCFKNFILKYNIKYNLLNNKIGANEKNIESYNMLVEQVKKELKEFDNIENINNVEELCFIIKNYVNSDNFIKKFQNYIEKLKIIDDFQYKIEQQAIEKLNNLLDNTSEILYGVSLSTKEFLDLLSTGANSTTISILPLSADCVFVGDINNSVFDEVNSLYICGVNESNFPIIQNDIGIISDSELDKLTNKCVIEPSIRKINSRTRLKCIQLVSNFKSRLFMSYSTLDINGNSATSSSIFKQLQKLVNVYSDKMQMFLPLPVLTEEMLTFSYSNMENLLFSMPNKQIAKNNILNVIKNKYKYLDEANFDNYNKIYNYLLKNDNNFVKLLNNLENERYICDNSTLNLFKDNFTSISEIEKYYDCPFKHFASFSLKLKEQENGENLSSQIGTILHSVCEQFVTYLLNNNFDIIETEIENKATEYFDNAIKENNFEYIVLNTENKLFIKDLQLECVRLINFLYSSIKNSKFKPLKAEASFGYKNSNLKEIELKTDNSTYKVRGKIDRIDTFENYFRIIDYKSGSTSFDFEQLYYGKKLQLFVYQKALIDQTGQTSAGAFYLPLRNAITTSQEDELMLYRLDGVVLDNVNVVMAQDTSLSVENKKSKMLNVTLSLDKTTNRISVRKNINVLSEEEIVKLSEYAHLLCVNALNEILANNIKAKPLKNGQKNSCEYCAYKSLCRFNTETDGYRTVSCNIKVSNNKGGEEDA